MLVENVEKDLRELVDCPVNEVGETLRKQRKREGKKQLKKAEKRIDE